MALFFTLQLLAMDNGRLRITSAHHLEAAAWGEGATPLSIKFWASNHTALGHIVLVVGHGRSGVPLSNTRLH